MVFASEYRALFDEGQAIFDIGREEISKNFSFGDAAVMDVYAHYANVMLRTTKQQDKQRLLQILELLAEKVDMMCALANKAESELF